MEETQDGCIEKKEEALHLLKEIGDGSKQAGDILQQLLLKIRNKQVNIENGIGFFDVKNQLLIFYLINLCQLIILKASGKSIEENSAIERLVELRVTLDKIRPIDQKLKYQVEKLVKIAIKGARNENDPCRFKANPGNMTNEGVDGELSEDSDDVEDSKKPENKKVGIYVPPKLSAVHYDGDDTYEIKKQKIIDRARKHALRSSVMEELKEQYLDTPVEIVQTNSLKQKEDKYQKHKQEYEENYLTRLPVTKEELRRKKRISTLGTLGDEITRFENTSILHKEQDFSSEKKKSRKRKAAKGKKNSRGKKKRKLH
ncbi:neuroguidin [Rhodnius prolixus]